jgi:hypothetical protein
VHYDFVEPFAPPLLRRVCLRNLRHGIASQSMSLQDHQRVGSPAAQYGQVIPELPCLPPKEILMGQANMAQHILVALQKFDRQIPGHAVLTNSALLLDFTG